MPFCPKCRYEYEPNVYECPDCGALLVDSLPEESQGKDHKAGSDLKEIYSTYNPAEAEMVKGLLLEEGIFSEVLEEFFKRIIGPRTRFRVMAREADLVRAGEILSDYFKDEPLEPSGEVFACSRCGAEIPEEADTCHVCGEEFDEGYEGEEEFFTCSGCGAGVDARALFCPACGERFDEDDEPAEGDYTVCPNCGAKADAGMDSCPVCKKGFPER